MCSHLTSTHLRFDMCKLLCLGKANNGAKLMVLLHMVLEISWCKWRQVRIVDTLGGCVTPQKQKNVHDRCVRVCGSAHMHFYHTEEVMMFQ